MVRNMQLIKGNPVRRTRGQGMVEFALSLPLLLLLLAGLMEIVNLVLLYSRMEAVTREASRFGALGGTDTGVREVFMQSARDSLETQPGVIEMWVVRPVLEYDQSTQTYTWEGSTGPASWGVDEVCAYPDTGCENTTSGIQPQDILNQITESGTKFDTADGDRIVIVGTYYEARTILNLPFYEVPGGEAGRVPLRTVAVYRQEVDQETVNMLASGCTALPIMINMNAVSVSGNKKMNPEAGLAAMAREGTIFELTRDISRATDGSSNTPGTDFDFLAWRIDQQEAARLDAALDFPGNISDPNYGYIHPYEPSDRMLNLGDMVTAQKPDIWASQAVLNSSEYTGIDGGGFQRAIRVILSNGKSQPNDSVYSGYTFRFYEVMGFAIVHVNEYTPNGTLEVEFVRFDTSCGEADKK